VNVSWSERFLGGSPEKEADVFRVFAEEIRGVQARNRRRSGPIERAFHAKQVAGIAGARFLVSPDLREELRSGVFAAGAEYRATVRFSNASGITRPDTEPDLRGIAIRVHVDSRGPAVQDFLMTNAPASHARDAAQFMAAARATAGGRRLRALLSLIRSIGLREALRMLKAIRRASGRPVASLATEAFWSRAPYAVGPHALKFKLEPTAPPSSVPPPGPNALREELVGRLRREDVRFLFRVQQFVDERTTPIEDGTVEWLERDAPPQTIGELIIPRQDLTEPVAGEGEAAVDALAFDPWHTTEGIRPIGSLNRARRIIYESSAANRLGSARP
jgi:hypothetical protein